MGPLTLVRQVGHLIFFLMPSLLFAQSNEANGRYEQAKKYMDEGQLIEASNVFSKIQPQKLPAQTQPAFFYDWAYTLQLLGKLDSALLINDRALKTNTATPMWKYKCHIGSASIQLENGQIASSESHLRQAKLLNDAHTLNKTGHLMIGGQIAVAQADYANALKYYLESYQINEKRNRFEDVVRAVIEIGAIYHLTGKHKEAIEAYRKAIKIQTVHQIQTYMSDCYQRLGSTYINMQDYPNAIKEIEKGIEYGKREENHYLLNVAYSNLSICYMSLKQNDKARMYLNLSKEHLLENTAMKSANADWAATATGIYYDLGDYDEAEKVALSALDLTDKHHLFSKKQELLSLLSKIYAAKKDYLQSYQYLDQHLNLKDSLQNLDKEKISQNLFKKYEIAEKERTLAEKELALAKQKNATQRWLLVSLCGFMLVVSLGGVVYYNRIRNEQGLNASFDLIIQKVKALRQQMENGDPSDFAVLQDGGTPQVQHVIEQVATFEQDMLDKLKTTASFNYLVSHEVRRDLKQIEHSLEVFDKGAKNNEKNALQDCTKRVSKLDELVKELLSLSELEQKPLYNTAFPLTELIEELKQELRIPANCQLMYKNLPVIQGDRLLLRQVFANLLSNAVKYSSGKSEIIIKILAEIGDDMQIKVIDNGLGFDPSLSHHLFQPFRRLHANITGTGVGLMVVKAIVEKHGGKVFAYNNNEGGGATFGFSLPKTAPI